MGVEILMALWRLSWVRAHWRFLRAGNEEKGGVVSVDEDLVADGNGLDDGGGLVGEDVEAEPGEAEGAGAGGGEELLVGEVNGEGDAGAGEGAEDGGVGIVDLDARDRVGAEEGGDEGGGGKVGGGAAVVDADGSPLYTGEGNEERKDEEEVGEAEEKVVAGGCSIIYLFLLLSKED
ncbi:hypothetical protein MLD38_009104 [Melastoma candidum]|uniref:Uncharacterized protein n=1 Tax=Melastoma candidum TaxID=119954 RepID=A0ACB9RX11_9MYRT|nr:hypothetical protein MLD38_009104 [Melastoma candidum]